MIRNRTKNWLRVPRLWLGVVLTLSSPAAAIRADAPISDPAALVYPNPPIPPVIVQEHLLTAARTHISSKFPEVGSAFVLEAATTAPSSDSLLLEFSANPRLEQRVETTRGPRESWTHDWIAVEVSPDGKVNSSHKALRTSNVITLKDAAPLFFGRPSVAVPGRVKSGAVFAVVGDIAAGGGVRMNRNLRWELGASYGWDLNIFPAAEGVVIKTVFTLPEPATIWPDLETKNFDPNVATEFKREISSDSSALTESLTLTSRNTVRKISRYGIAEGDPEGTYNLKVYLNDELALDTSFEVDRKTDSTDEVSKTARRIRAHALKYVSALVASEPEVAVHFIYPGLVRSLGGKRAAVSMLKKETGSRFVAIDIGTPETPITRGDERFAKVPTTVILEGPAGRVRMSSFLVAISSDEGSSWTFLEGRTTTAATLALIGLVLPPEFSFPQAPADGNDPKT